MISINTEAAWGTIQILKKPSDQDLHCIVKRIYPGSRKEDISGFSRQSDQDLHCIVKRIYPGSAGHLIGIYTVS